MRTIYQKEFYLPTFLDNRTDRQGNKTGDYSGYVLGRKYTIYETKFGNRRFKKGVKVWGFSGKNNKEFLKELRLLIKGKKQLPSRADGDLKFIPKEVENKL